LATRERSLLPADLRAVPHGVQKPVPISGAWLAVQPKPSFADRVRWVGDEPIR
jgi:hypothetical protein